MFRCLVVSKDQRYTHRYTYYLILYLLHYYMVEPNGPDIYHSGMVLTSSTCQHRTPKWVQGW